MHKEIDKIRRCNIDNFWNYVKNDGNSIFQNKKKILLVCSECKIVNYSTNKTTEERLIINKFCPRCNKHTEHKENK